MEEEQFFSGYCRKLDRSRTVTAEVTDGRFVCADCDYGSCVYQSACPIAKEIEVLDT